MFRVGITLQTAVVCSDQLICSKITRSGSWYVSQREPWCLYSHTDGYDNDGGDVDDDEYGDCGHGQDFVEGSVTLRVEEFFYFILSLSLV